MVNSIHKQNIYNHELDRYISPYQKKILESYRLDENIFILTLQDNITKEIYNFAKWESAVKEDVTVYDYMKRNNITIEKLEIQYQRAIKANQEYDKLL